ncbi:MAG: hypothetical protein L3J24_10125 [Xanthomonadales bacterium]|nr:hypothetical protein [Xanthomonadales bacterium]
MIKRLSQLVCVFLFMTATNTANALTCGKQTPSGVVKQFDTIFVAFVLDGYFVEGENVKSCGWIEGSFEVIESLKGNSDSVTLVRKKLRNCNGMSVGGASDNFPIGKTILVTTNSDIADIGQCTTAWYAYETYCFIDNIRRQLNIDAPNVEVRERCIEDENSKGESSRVYKLRKYLIQLESESEAVSSEIKETKGLLSEAELGVSAK